MVIQTNAKLSEIQTFPLYSSNEDKFFWKKYQFWLKNVSLFAKKLIGTVESVLKPNFDLNQGYKIVLTQNHLLRDL